MLYETIRGHESHRASAVQLPDEQQRGPSHHITSIHTDQSYASHSYRIEAYDWSESVDQSYASNSTQNRAYDWSESAPGLSLQMTSQSQSRLSGYLMAELACNQVRLFESGEQFRAMGKCSSRLSARRAIHYSTF